MDKKRILGVIVGATLIIAVVLVALGYNAAPMAKGSSSSFTGLGDLRRFENQLALSDNTVKASSRSNASMGNLRRYEALPALKVEAFDAAWRKSERSRSAIPAISQNTTVFDAKWWNSARIRSGISATSPRTSALEAMRWRSAGNHEVVRYGPPGR
jgi:hypothetical protein